MNRRRFLAVSAAALTASPTRAETARWRGVALGAEAEITLRGDPVGAERALAAARRTMAEAEALFSLYREDSALSRLNREGRLKPPPRFADLIALCDRLWRATDGRFDPTVQPLWGALATGGDAAAARRLIGWDRVEVADEVVLAQGQALTLNGVAQGFATDMVAEALAAEGFGETLVNIGEFRAGEGDWRVGVADPNGGLLRIATLHRSAIATSSPMVMALGDGSHIIGPNGETPVWNTVSIEAKTAALADGLSTGLCLVGKDEAVRMARSVPGVSRITLAQNGDFNVIDLTP